MDNRFLRTLIYIFSGLIVVFGLLMLVNYLGSVASSGSERAGKEAAEKKTVGAADMAQEALAAAKTSGGGSASMAPYSKEDSSSPAVNSNGAIMLVKENNFGGVAEKPKDMMDILNGMSGGDKRKPAPISLKDSDLDKKIDVGGNPAHEPRLAASVMPEMGRGPGQEGLTMLSAPVDYKIFKSSETWWAFANTRKCRSTAETGTGLKPAVSQLSAPDFSKDLVVVLISVSELPNGIFSIVKFEKNGKEVLVSYRVNPMAMSAANGTDLHDFYSAAVIPKAAAVKLLQVP